MRRVIGRMTVVAALLASTAVDGTASAGPSGGALPPVLIEALQIGGEHGVPADAAMVAATITAIDPAENGWIKAFPCDAEPPDTANLNYAADQIANNLVLARLSADGRLCIATRSLTDYVVDVAGYVPAGSTITPLPSPVRALDTRNGTGGSNPSPVPDGGTVELVLADTHGIPTEATLAVFNLTAVGGPTGGRITAHPCDEAPGTTSSVNFPAGRNVANLVVSRLSADGAVCLLAKNASDMVVDVAGYATGGITTLPTPRRVLDTRSRGGVLDAEASVTVDPGLPGDATAAIYNLTAVDAPTRGFATAHPCDEARPTSSNLNFNGPQAVGAGSITKLDAAGTFCLFAKSPVNLIVDLIGYTTDDATYVPMSPVRITDTREGWQSTCPWVVTLRPRPTPVYRATNVKTLRTVTIPAGDGASRRTIEIAPDCDVVHWHEEVGGRTLIRQMPLTEGASPVDTEIAASAAFTGELSKIAELDDGRWIGVTSQGDIFDLAVDGYLWITSRSILHPQITTSGLLIFQSSVWRIEIFDLHDGSTVGGWTWPGVTFESASLSPDERYLAFGVRAAVPGSVRSGVVVTTLGGDIVDEVLYTDSAFTGGQTDTLTGHFTGPGTIALCAENLGFFELDLWGPARFVAPFDDPAFWGTPFATRQCEGTFWN